MIVHRTCAHSYASIRSEAVVKPNLHPALGIRVSWWCEDWMDARSLGLTSVILHCDRMEYVVVPMHREALIPWTQYARRLPRRVRDLVETPGTMPRYWWVAEKPVPILVDDHDVLEVEREAR